LCYMIFEVQTYWTSFTLIIISTFLSAQYTR